MKNILLTISTLLLILVGSVHPAQSQVTISTGDELLLPQYCVTGSAFASRAPLAVRLRLTGLSATTTYRYFTGASTNNAITGSTVPGNMFSVSSTSGYAGYITGYTSSKGMNGSLLDSNQYKTSGNMYGEFTTDNNGEYSGYFTLLPTGNSVFTAGNDVYFYVFLNDGLGGTTVNTRYRTSSTIRVLNYGTNANTANEASAVYGYSSSEPEAFVFVYNNQAGTGRPLYGSWTQDEGITTDFGGWYTRLVDTTKGAWCAVIPNDLDSGIRRIESRDIDGNLIISHKDADGTWPSGANTVDPSADTVALFISNSDAPLSTPKIEFVSSRVNQSEDSVKLTIEVELTRPSANNATSVDIAVATGTTAAKDSDYLFTPVTLTWNAGQSGKKTFNVTVLEDQLTEGDEYLILELKNQTNDAVLGNRSKDTIAIVDDENTIVYFEKTNETYQENSGIVKIAVKVKNPNINVGSSVEVAFYGGTTTFGSDFYFASQTVTFPPNSTATQYVDLDIKNDAVKEGTETIIMYLLNPSAGTNMESIYDTITVLDDDGSTLKFKNSGDKVSEKVGTYSFAVSITKPDAGVATTVDVEITGGTGSSADHSFTKQTLTFPAGSSADQNVSVTLTDDNLKEGDETLVFSLKNPGNNALIGSPATFTLTIDDDDSTSGGASIQFVSDTSSVAEGSMASIPLSISKAPTSPITVTFAYSGTAVQGTNFSTPPANVVFPSAVSTNRNIGINTLSDNLASGNKTVVVTISQVSTGGAAAGITSHTLTIIDNGKTGIAVDAFSPAKVQVFPNPAQNSIHVRSAENIQSIRLYNVDGRLIFGSNPNDLTTTIDLSKMAAGILILEVNTLQGTEKIKILHQ